MTDEQINQAIAKACGIVGKSGEIYKTPDGWVVDCPQFCTDLNAMHDAEKTLKIGYCKEYKDNLYDAALELEKKTGRWMPYSLPARQRAEEFLRTLGKWEATDKESLTVGATAENSSVDHFRDITKMMRFQAAVAAMQGHIVHRGFSENAKHTADLAVRYADALILELQRKEQS